jgi:integrase
VNRVITRFEPPLKNGNNGGPYILDRSANDTENRHRFGLDRKNGEAPRIRCTDRWTDPRDNDKLLFRKYAVAAEVSRELAHPHILRHSLCSTMAAEPADVYAIQQRAGHKNISNTMIYTHVSDEQASESCREALMTAFA